MDERASVTLNIIEYACACIYPKKKQSAEYARILNVSDAVHSKGHCTNYWEVIEIDTYSGDGQTFKMARFAKRIMPDCRCATRNFSGQEVGEICGTRPLRYRFRQKHQKKWSRREPILESFLLDTLKTTFWMEKLTQTGTQSEPFLQKSGHFFWLSERVGETSP